MPVKVYCSFHSFLNILHSCYSFHFFLSLILREQIIILYRVGGTCRVYGLHHSIVHTLLLPTPLVGITIIPLQSILIPWCFVSGRPVDVFPLRLLLPHSDSGCRDPCLKVGICGPDTEHLASPFIFHRNGFVAWETSAVLLHCIAVGALWGFQQLAISVTTETCFPYWGNTLSLSSAVA
jgi:hypothetical protein